MKRIIILSAFFITLLPVSYSQRSDSSRVYDDGFRTLLGYNRSRGAYGAFTIGYSTIDLHDAVQMGGKIEWLVAHSFGFGFGGTGFINEYHYDAGLARNVFLTGGYGGLFLEPVLFPKFPVHLSFPALFGAGGISYITKGNDTYHNMIQDSQAFLVAEPSVELEMNVTRHFRLAFGTSYRFITPFNVGVSEVPKIDSDALRSWSYQVTFKFGRF
ncbi:MAG TPA: hypothetical protein VMT63_09690 [Bacteroidales bacterium]|nr:hypothetical protein [Bacteroidales bacterium]